MTAPRRIVATLVLSSGALLSGCGGGTPAAEPTPKMPPASSPSPTEGSTPDEPVEPTPPPEMEGTGVKAAEAFVEYYFALVTYAQSTGDTALLKDVGQPLCASCSGVVDVIDRTYETGGTVTGGELSVERLRMIRLDAPRGVRLFGGTAVVNSTQQVIKGSGDQTVDGRYSGGPRRYRVTVSLEDDGWRFSEWKSA